MKKWGGHRNPESDLQLEACEICGLLFPHTRLHEIERAHLGSLTICDRHPHLEGLSFDDYQFQGGREIHVEPDRLPPTSTAPAPWEG